jgi:hypothetical protein
VLLSFACSEPFWGDNLNQNADLRRHFLLGVPVLTSRSFCYDFPCPCTRTTFLPLGSAFVKGFISSLAKSGREVRPCEETWANPPFLRGAVIFLDCPEGRGFSPAAEAASTPASVSRPAQLAGTSCAGRDLRVTVGVNRAESPALPMRGEKSRVSGGRRDRSCTALK